MVQHMNDATTSTIKDSTTNSQDGAKYAANQPIEVDGEIGKAQDFDGTNDYVDLGIVPASDTFNLSFWLPDKGTGSGIRYIYDRGPNRDVWGNFGLLFISSNFVICTNDETSDNPVFDDFTTFAEVTSGDYYSLNINYPSVKIYRNGDSTAIYDTT